MKNILLLTVFLAFMDLPLAGQDYNVIEQIYHESDGQILDFEMVDESVGYLVTPTKIKKTTDGGNCNILPTGLKNEIFKTLDGGTYRNSHSHVPSPPLYNNYTKKLVFGAEGEASFGYLRLPGNQTGLAHHEEFDVGINF